MSHFSRGLLVAVVACATTNALAGTAQAESAGRRVGIGNGRALYLVCAGPTRPQQPTIVLVSGYHDSSDVWTQDDALSLLPNARGPAVLPALSRTNRVCAYDRPGTVRYVNGFPLTDRSTPVTQPRTIEDIAAELHALLAAARVPRPYVLVGHSLGGLIVLFYAGTYPDEVRGAVFVDALSPSLPTRSGASGPSTSRRSTRAPISSRLRRSNCRRPKPSTSMPASDKSGSRPRCARCPWRCSRRRGPLISPRNTFHPGSR